MSNQTASFKARQFLDSVQKNMSDGLPPDFDEALLLCFLAGRRDELIMASRRRSMTINYWTIVAARSEALERFRRGKIPLDWEEQWAKLKPHLGLPLGQF